MSSKRRVFRRPLGERRYRKLFIIAVEGRKTEPQYFALLNSLFALQKNIHIECLESSNSSPDQVLKRMMKYLDTNPLRNTDEAWVVVDRDQWTEDQLNDLFEWSIKEDNYGFALSNPKFEYWLLLHFEDGNDLVSSHDCTDRLKRHLPNYDKSIDFRKITIDRITMAIARAKNRNNPSCETWPRTLGNTTVYRLIEKILSGNP